MGGTGLTFTSELAAAAGGTAGFGTDGAGAGVGAGAGAAAGCWVGLGGIGGGMVCVAGFAPGGVSFKVDALAETGVFGRLGRWILTVLLGSASISAAGAAGAA